MASRRRPVAVRARAAVPRRGCDLRTGTGISLAKIAKIAKEERDKRIFLGSESSDFRPPCLLGDLGDLGERFSGFSGLLRNPPFVTCIYLPARFYWRKFQ